MKFTSITNIPIQVSITRSGNHTAKEIVTGLAPGSYEVRIFDWEEDGSIATTSSHQDHVQVTSVPTTAGRPLPKMCSPNNYHSNHVGTPLYSNLHSNRGGTTALLVFDLESQGGANCIMHR